MIHAESISAGPASDRKALGLALLQQVLAGFLCIFDSHGDLARVFACAAAAFWIGVVWLYTRRRSHPARTDILFIRWGFFPLLLASFVLAAIRFRWNEA